MTAENIELGIKGLRYVWDISYLRTFMQVRISSKLW